MSLQNLRKNAELNLCDACYKKYLALIEPSIRKWLLEPLEDWRWVESQITRMVMMMEGVFKSDSIYIHIPEDLSDNLPDDVDVKKFIKIKRWNFKRKIKYLYDHKILKDSSYKLLIEVSDARNDVLHNILTGFSELDLILFNSVNAVISDIYNTMVFGLPQDANEKIRKNAEDAAERILRKIDKNKRILF